MRVALWLVGTWFGLAVGLVVLLVLASVGQSMIRGARSLLRGSRVPRAALPTAAQETEAAC